MIERRVVGVGVDLADVARLGRAMERRAGLAARLFAAEELDVVTGDRPLRVAQRFAVKEAAMKALGAGIDTVSFTEVVVDRDLAGISLRGRAARRARRLGVVDWVLRVSSVEGPAGELALVEVEALGRDRRSA